MRIEARTAAGAFYGTRTVLQLLRRGRQRSRPARARDWPRYPERGLMIDNGRRYFSPAWIKRDGSGELAYLKLNQLHLHFSDNEGFRIESESHPEVVSRPHLTKRQVRGIVELRAPPPRPRHPRARHARAPARGARGPSRAAAARGVASATRSTSRCPPRAASAAS